jgi:hypothetical protein
MIVAGHVSHVLTLELLLFAAVTKRKVQHAFLLPSTVLIKVNCDHALHAGETSMPARSQGSPVRT